MLFTAQLAIPFYLSFFQGPEKISVSMKSDLETNSTTSPPSKKLRTADFSSIIKRSHSMTEEALEIEMSSAYKKKIVNDRYTVGQKIKKVWSKKLKHIYMYI